jgi:tight adherence protein C
VSTLVLIAACIATSVASLVLFVAQLSPQQSTLRRRLEELEHAGQAFGSAAARHRRELRTERLQEVVQAWGKRIEAMRSDTPVVRQFLLQGGFAGAAVVPIYWGTRAMLTLGFGAFGLLVFPLLVGSALAVAIAAFWFAALGWILPPFVVRWRVKARQRIVIRALPDALDMMVVCVEAGLALNQALVRVSEEIVHVSPLMSEQLALVNLEIRAGTSREEALRNLGERTGVDDVRSLVTMLIQTDRFGTSIASALRVHADTLRTKRRQRAEEASAKTTIKLLFPLVFFVFPAMFVVILGPAMIQIVRTLSQLV